jgi:hypothetical protein
MIEYNKDDIDNKWRDYCKHPEHNFPGHLVIPPGETHEHICPGCGQIIIIYGAYVPYLQ